MGWSFITTRNTSARTYPSPKLEPVQGLSDIVAIAAGNKHYLALRSDGQLFAWGDNEYGQATVPPGGASYTRIFAMGDLSFAVREDGKLVGWGDDRDGALDFPDDMTGVIDMAWSLALKDIGTVVAWHPRARFVPEINDAIAISSSMALLSDGTIVTWRGTYDVGQHNVPPGLRVK
jgi:hypothetical protein